MAAHSPQNLDDRLHDLLRSVLTTGDHTLSTVMINDWLFEGRAELLESIPPSKLDRYATSLAGGTNGVISNAGKALPTRELLRVTRFDLVDEIPCQSISAAVKHLARNANSIHRATERFPSYYMEGGSVYVLPVPTSTEYGSIYYVDTESAIDSTGATISNFPPEAISILLSYAAYRASVRESSMNRREAFDQFNLITEAGGDLPTYIALIPDLTEYIESSADSTLKQPAFGFDASDYTAKLNAALDDVVIYLKNNSSSDFQDFLTGNDPEMAQTAVNGALAQLKLAENLIANHAMYLNEYKTVAGIKASVPEMYLKQLQSRLAVTAQHLEHSKQALAVADMFFKEYQRGVARLSRD